MQPRQVKLRQKKRDVEKFLSTTVVGSRHEFIGCSAVSRHLIRIQHVKDDIAITVVLINIYFQGLPQGIIKIESLCLGEKNLFSNRQDRTSKELISHV